MKIDRKEYMRSYYLKNKEEISKKKKIYYQINREQILKLKKGLYQKTRNIL
jgi:hypothetical protein